MEDLHRIFIPMAAAAALSISGPCGFAQDKPQDKPSRPAYTLGTANYNFLIASGFLCEISGRCQAVAQDADGNTIEISGVGTLRMADRSVTGAGSFSEKSRNGAMMTTGVWTATELVSFQPYGTAPFELQREYPDLRAISTFATRRPMLANPLMPVRIAQPLAAGGQAVIRIRLIHDVGADEDAVLTINCAKGKAPQDNAVDSVKVSIAGGPAFDEQVSGRTVFLLLAPTPNPAPASPSMQH